MARVFITFGNRRFRRAKRRLAREAEALGVFDRVTAHGPKDLGEAFWRAHERFVKRHARGYGFYLWKPYLVWHTLRALADDDILVYADAGCKIYPQHAPRLHEYFEIVTRAPTGILCFALRALEQAYTKADLAARLGVLHDPRVMASPQVAGGIHVTRKCTHSVAVMRRWYAIAGEDYHWIDNSPSRRPNHPTFQEHRHDQSILSLLVKIHGAEIITDETYPPGSGPISADRLRK